MNLSCVGWKKKIQYFSKSFDQHLQEMFWERFHILIFWNLDFVDILNLPILKPDILNFVKHSYLFIASQSIRDDYYINWGSSIPTHFGRTGNAIAAWGMLVLVVHYLEGRNSDIVSASGQCPLNKIMEVPILRAGLDSIERYLGIGPANNNV